MPKHCANDECPALARDGVAAEYTDAMKHCAECGDYLMPGEVPPPPPVEYRALVPVYTALGPTQAHLIRAALEAEGIEAQVLGEPLGAAIGELPANVIEVSVAVAPEDEERAREIARRIGG